LTDQSDLVRHLARFAGALRQRGVGVTLSDEADGLMALTLIDVGDRDEVRRALRAALKIRQRDAAVFEELFDLLWTVRYESTNPPVPAPGIPVPSRPKAGNRPGRQATESEVERALGLGDELGYSPEAVLRRKSFEEYSTADLVAMERLLSRLILRLATRPSRRRVPVRGRGEADLRRSFRRAIAHGGEFLSLARRARPIERPRLLVLCDTSGSMDPHTRFLLTFMLALRRVTRSERSSEIFAFNTTLVRLTPWANTSVAHWTCPARPSGSLNASEISAIAVSQGSALTAAAKISDTRCENAPIEIITAPPSCADRRPHRPSGPLPS